MVLNCRLESVSLIHIKDLDPHWIITNHHQLLVGHMTSSLLFLFISSQASITKLMCQVDSQQVFC